MDKQLRILLADDDRHVRSGLRAFLSATLPCEIVGEAKDGQDAIVQVALHQPDAVVLDLRMPAMDGLQAARVIKTNWPHTQIVALSLYTGERTQALAAGADVFVGKGDPPMNLVTCLLTFARTTGAGEAADETESTRVEEVGETR